MNSIDVIFAGLSTDKIALIKAAYLSNPVNVKLTNWLDTKPIPDELDFNLVDIQTETGGSFIRKTAWVLWYSNGVSEYLDETANVVYRNICGKVQVGRLWDNPMPENVIEAVKITYGAHQGIGEWVGMDIQCFRDVAKMFEMTAPPKFWAKKKLPNPCGLQKIMDFIKQ